MNLQNKLSDLIDWTEYIRCLSNHQTKSIYLNLLTDYLSSLSELLTDKIDSNQSLNIYHNHIHHYLIKLTDKCIKTNERTAVKQIITDNIIKYQTDLTDQLINQLCLNLDIFINESHDVTNTDNPLILYHLFVRLFLPKCMMWERSWMNLIDKSVESIKSIDQFNQLMERIGWPIQMTIGDLSCVLINNISKYFVKDNFEQIKSIINFYRIN